jgi:hypothetical protein
MIAATGCYRKDDGKSPYPAGKHWKIRSMNCEYFYFILF